MLAVCQPSGNSRVFLAGCNQSIYVPAAKLSAGFAHCMMASERVVDSFKDLGCRGNAGIGDDLGDLGWRKEF